MRFRKRVVDQQVQLSSTADMMLPVSFPLPRNVVVVVTGGGSQLRMGFPCEVASFLRIRSGRSDQGRSSRLRYEIEKRSKETEVVEDSVQSHKYLPVSSVLIYARNNQHLRVNLPLDLNGRRGRLLEKEMIT